MACAPLQNAPLQAEGPLRDSAFRHPSIRSYVARVSRDWFNGAAGTGALAAEAAGKGGGRAAKPRPARRPQARRVPNLSSRIAARLCQ